MPLSTDFYALEDMDFLIYDDWCEPETLTEQNNFNNIEEVCENDQSLRDLWALVMNATIKQLKSKNVKPKYKREKRSALYWIKSDHDGFNSFIGICLLLGWCPDYTRETILNDYYKKGGT